MASAFEPDLTGTIVSGLFHGHMNSVVSHDPQGRSPTSVISMQDQWYLTVEWEFDGMLIQGGLLSGTWIVQPVLETMGPGDDILLGEFPVDIATGGVPTMNGRKYTKTYGFGPGIPAKPGAYWLATVITSKGTNGVPGPFAGYFESPTLMFHQGSSLPQA